LVSEEVCPKKQIKNSKNAAEGNFNAKEYGFFRPGYQGLGTLFLCVNKQILNPQALSFKMIPKTACHLWVAANMKN